MPANIEAEIERNFAAFKDKLDSLLGTDEGRYALMRDQQVVGTYERPGVAERVGHERFPDGRYSIQLISSQPLDLGFYSYAVSHG